MLDKMNPIEFMRHLCRPRRALIDTDLRTGKSVTRRTYRSRKDAEAVMRRVFDRGDWQLRMERLP